VTNPSAANSAQNPSGSVNPALFGSQASGVPACAARLVIQHAAAANTLMIERLKVMHQTHVDPICSTIRVV
jgi:hypothetical protein